MTTMTNPDFREELLAVFAQEGTELLERMERELLDIEHASEERRQKGLVTIRRTLHTLKGAAGALGIAPIVRLCHELEEGLGDDDGAFDFESSFFDTFHNAIAYMRALVDGDNADDGDDTRDEVMDSIQKTFRSGDDAPPAPLSDKTAPSGPDPSPASGDDSSSRRPPGSSTDAIDDVPRSRVIRVDNSRLDDLQAVAGELVVLNLQHDESQRRVETLRDTLAGILSQWRTLGAEMRELSGEVSTPRWQRLQRRSTEVTRELKAAYRESYEFAQWSVGHAGQLGLVSNALEDGLRNIRMQPLGPFLDSFARVNRGAARKQGKQVRFESRGREIQIDRSVLERLREPMIHLVRNAVAHGIEPPERRRNCGKPAVGTVRVSAHLLGEKVCLEVRDDGSGIDAETVRRKAVESGIARSDEAAAQRQLLDLLVHPGFSTRRTTDEVAGRGIGLDVVEAAVAEVGGRLELENMPGEGAAFRLIVPTSITTSQGLILEVATYRLGIQIDAVERIVRIDDDDLQLIEGNHVYYHDDDPVAVASLARLLGIAVDDPSLSPGRRIALILRNGGQRLAVTVDDIPGEMPMVVKPLGPQFDSVRHLTGGAIQADGSILPVLEHRELFRRATGRRRSSYDSLRSQAMAGLEASDDQARGVADDFGPSTILVVDDSVTTRTLERNILETAGYQVVTATDGADAFETLERRDDVELLVTDVEMPRMGGLELCRQVREHHDTELPIIVVTSRGDDDDIRRGMKAGADAYIVKGKFDQEHFMSTIQRFVH